MYAALCRLIDDPIPADKLTHFMTPKCWCCSKELVCMESDDSHENLGHKSHETASLVIRVKKKLVGKYYDPKFHYIPCKEVIAFIPGARCIFSTESRFQILQYPYLEERHSLQNVAEVVVAIRALDMFHAEHYVHGDIRESNMIVSGNSVNFVDVDMTGKEGTTYPGTYNHTSVIERHENAKKNRKMEKIHDRFALHCIITKKNKYTLEDISVHVSLTNVANSLQETEMQGN